MRGSSMRKLHLRLGGYCFRGVTTLYSCDFLSHRKQLGVSAEKVVRLVTPGLYKLGAVEVLED